MKGLYRYTRLPFGVNLAQSIFQQVIENLLQWLVVGEFVSEREDWLSYIEQLKSYFVANDVVTGDKKRTVLLNKKLLSHLKTIEVTQTVVSSV